MLYLTQLLKDSGWLGLYHLDIAGCYSEGWSPVLFYALDQR